MAYTTTNALGRYLGLSGDALTKDADLLDDIIPRAQAVIDEHCRRTFEASANTSRVFDAIGGHISDDYLTLYLDEDLVSLNSITNGDGTSISTSDVVLLPANDTPKYAIRIKSNAATSVSWTYSGSWEQAITISGKWAYSETAPADITHATVRLAAYMYRQKDGNNDDDRTIVTEAGVITPSNLPKDVADILKPYRKVIFGTPDELDEQRHGWRYGRWR